MVMLARGSSDIIRVTPAGPVIWITSPLRRSQK